MAVTGTPYLAFSGHSGRDDVTGVRDYMQRWIVWVDDPRDGAKTVKAHPGVPQFGSYYQTPTEVDTQAFVRDRQADRISDESGVYWHVDIDYSTQTDNGQGALIPQVEPLNLAPELEWDFAEFQEIASFCYLDEGDGNTKKGAVVNSAKDLHNPPLEKDGGRLVLRVQRNLGKYDPILAYTYANVLNSDTWYGFPRHTVLMKPWKAKSVIEKGLFYWRVNFEFHFNFETWLYQLWDSGMREYVESENEKGFKRGYNHIKDDDGNFVTEPVLLNGFGRRLVPKGGILKLNEVKPIANKFRVYRQLPFTPLQII
jgi:hypothetical protein